MNDASGAPPAWSGAEQYDPMVGTDHDFSTLLDFDLDFPDFANDAQQLPEDLDVQRMHNAFSPAVPQEQHRNDTPAAHQQQQQRQRQQPNDVPGISQTGGNFFEFTMPYPQHNVPAFTQAADHMYRPHSAVPPTPNSVELHGDPTRYLQHIENQQAMFDQRYQLRKEETTFTPLVSPVVAPHETRFQVPEVATTVPGAYFSPLTSPALGAQHYPQPHAHSSHYSGSSTGASPIDVDMESLDDPAMGPTNQGMKLRSANRRTAPRLSGPTRLRQSPNGKPRRQKVTVTSLIPPKEVSGLREEERANRPSSSGADLRRSRESSASDSVSPGPLSEMGPPPKPASVSQSPAMLAQNNQGASQGGAPATPASLMHIHPSPTFGAPGAPPPLDDLRLPEASLDRVQLTRTDTAIHDSDQDTPRLVARKTPKLGPLSTPSGTIAQTGKPSPMLSAGSSPTSPALFNKKGDAKSARNSKKRNSVTSNLVSPALRPKISPSIKPLLPEGAVSDDTHALLLASKSNYQNILDGTTVPGVVYPTSLSTNLTSKRTSHKIAEQGRRNRINTALQEMQALLPSPQLGAKESKSPDSGSAQSNNSKAAKVESAIEYIRQLQKQCSDKDKLLDQKDQEVEALRKELAALRRSSSSGAVSSSDAPMQSTEEDAT